MRQRPSGLFSNRLHRLIDSALDNEPSFLDEEGQTNTMPVRKLLELADHDDVEPDPAWLQAYGHGQ